MRHRSRLKILASLPTFAPEVVREEPSQCRVPCAVAREAGPVHRSFVHSLPHEWQEDPQVEIFSRLLWLKEGWMPIALGFHLDWGASPRFPQRVETLIANYGGCSFTEFVIGDLELPEAEQPERRSARSKAIEHLVDEGRVATTQLREGVLAHFDNQSWHRATPAIATGWRLLVRAIRGLPQERRQGDGDGFSSMRNGFIPRTPDEIARHAPYRSEA